MNNFKSFTSIEQSKKLAEILPLESADQVWARIAIAGANLDVPEELQYKHNGDMLFQYYSGIGIPCWSLSALYSVLPTFTLDSSDDKYFRIHCCNKFSEWHDNPVDACYEMIIKLCKQNLL